MTARTISLERKIIEGQATINDIADAMCHLVEKGLGHLPINGLVVPDATLQAIARNVMEGDYEEPQDMVVMVSTKAPGSPEVEIVSFDNEESVTLQ